MNAASIVFRCQVASCWISLSRGYRKAPFLASLGHLGHNLDPSLASFKRQLSVNVRQRRVWKEERRKHTMEFGADCVAEGECAPPPAGILDPAPEDGVQNFSPPEVENVLFVEAGWGADQHGQNVTKAAVRACRNAIEFNSIPSIRRLVPGGYNGLRLKVKIGVPRPGDVDIEEVRKVFPYGEAFFEVVEGGLSCGSGISIAKLGDTSDEMVIAVAAVTVGYNNVPSGAPPTTHGYMG